MSLRRQSAETAPRGLRLVGFPLLVAVLLPLLALRACDERTLWIDEIHTLQLSQLPLPRLLDEAARDVHPPGYALALKGWIELGRRLAEAGSWDAPWFEPGTPWARGINLAAWLLAVAWCWSAGRAALGRGGGALLTLAAGGSAAAAVVAGDLRGYAVAWAALSIAVVALAALAALAPAERPWRQAALWTAYALAVAAALWNHLLAGPAAVLLAVAWLALAVRRRGTAAAWRLAPGLAAQAAAWLLFLPWLVRIPAQIAHLDRVATDWMTPASVGNLVAVFARWLPLGRAALPPAAAPWLVALGGVAVALPLAGWGWARWRRRSGTNGGEPRDPAAALAVLALGTAVGGVLAGWLLARLGWAATFHAPRYPLIVAGPFAAGLAAAALAAAPRRPARAALLLAPWLVASLAGQLLALEQADRPGGLVAFRAQIERWVEAGGVATHSDVPYLHVTPPELIPFVRHAFAGFELAEPKWIVCSRSGSYPVDLLIDVNPWRSLDRGRDRLLRHLLAPGRLAAEVERTDWHDAQTTATAYRLRGVDPALAEELCARELRPRDPVPESAATAALPGDQLAGDGWLSLDIGGDLVARRWGARREVRLRFDREVPAGRYRLHLAGHRHPHPEPVETLALRLDGGGALGVVSLPAGRFDLDLPLELDDAGRPRLLVEHPVWSPARATGSSDRRWLSFQLEAAWLVPVATAP